MNYLYQNLIIDVNYSRSNSPNQQIKNMKRILVGVLFILTLLDSIYSIPPVFQQSDRYVRTGVFEITSSPFSTKKVNNDYTVTFTACNESSQNYVVGLSLYSLDIKFDGLRIQFDIDVIQTTVTGFTVNFETLMGKHIGFLKYCYIVDNPTDSNVFNIEEYRYQGPQVKTTSSTPITQQFDFPQSLPNTTILSNLTILTFLTSFDFRSTITGTGSNIDISPRVSLIDLNTLQLTLSTTASDVNVSFYSFTTVFFDDEQVKANGIGRYTVGMTESNVSSGDLNYTTAGGLQMFAYNTFVGMQSFYSAVGQTPNFLNFQTLFTNTSFLQFPSTNDNPNFTWQYMRFDILIIQSVTCPASNPYYLFYMNDCVAEIPNGYTASCNKDVIIDFQMNLVYVVKVMWRNVMVVMVDVMPSGGEFRDLMSLVDWQHAISVDVNATVTVDFLPNSPQLRLTITYTDDLDGQTLNISIAPYNPSLYPINFKGLSQDPVQLTLNSINNLAINSYDDNIYNLTQRLEGVFILLSSVYMILFFMGLVVGKLYVLEMVLVPQITFLCILSLENIAPTLQSISFLRYSFGFWYSYSDTTIYPEQSKNYLNMVGVADDFFLNCNVMLGFIVANYVAGLVAHAKKKEKIKKFFLFDTALYLILWMSKWLFLAGCVQIHSIIIDTNVTIQQIFGVIFFVLWLILFCVYFAIYFKFHPQFEAFDSHFTFGTKAQDGTKIRLFYLVFFIEQFLVATIAGTAYDFNHLDVIIAIICSIVLVLVVVFKPYKFRISPNSTNRITSAIRPNIRQIINYSTTILIVILLFIINQVQQSSFDIGLPILIIILLIINILANIYFLIFDERIKKDFIEFKRIFDINDDSQEVNLKKDQVKKRKQPKTYYDMDIDIVQSPSQRDSLINKKSQYEQTIDMSKMKSNYKNSHADKNNDHGFVQPHHISDDMSIDGQIMKVAEKNQEIYRKKLQQGTADLHAPQKQIPKIKSYHATPKDGSNMSKSKHSNYFQPQQLKR